MKQRLDFEISTILYEEIYAHNNYEINRDLNCVNSYDKSDIEFQDTFDSMNFDVIVFFFNSLRDITFIDIN